MSRAHLETPDRFPRGARRATAVLAAAGLALGVTALGAPAVGQSPPDAVPYEDLWGPTGSPDRVVLTPTEDPATSQAVTWRTTVDVETPILEVAEVEGGPGFVNYEGRSGRDERRTVVGETTGIVDETLHYPMRFHSAVIDGLAPDTTYLYRVGDGSSHNRTNWSEWFEFTTATEGASDFSFIYVGDAQNDIKEHVSRVFRRAHRQAPEARLFLSAGDLTDVADRDYEWGEWFHAGGYTTGSVNHLASPGNHEYFREQEANDTLAAYWDTQFNFPDNGPKPPEDVSAEDAEVYELLDRGNVHYVDYQGVRFVSLDSNGYQAFPAGPQRDAWFAIQAEWLDGILTDSPSDWTVIYHHHPVFSVSTGRDNPELRDAWLPVIEEHDVDLVLAGHDHTYGRGNLENATRVEDRGTGNRVHRNTVFAVSVSGPKQYDVSGSVWGENGADLVHTAQDTQLFQVIDVSERELHYEAYDAAGGFEDGFRIRKDARGNKVVTEVDGPRG